MCWRGFGTIIQFCQEWKQPAQRLWLSALVGDWFVVSELAASAAHMEEIANLAKQRAAECHSLRLARVTEMIAKFIEIDRAELPMPEWFHAIGELDGSQLAKYLRQALSMRDAAFCALRYIEEQDDGTWCPEVYAFERALRGNVSRNARGRNAQPRVRRGSGSRRPARGSVRRVPGKARLSGDRGRQRIDGELEVDYRGDSPGTPVPSRSRHGEYWGGACTRRECMSSAMP